MKVLVQPEKDSLLAIGDRVLFFPFGPRDVTNHVTALGIRDIRPADYAELVARSAEPSREPVSRRVPVRRRSPPLQARLGGARR